MKRMLAACVAALCISPVMAKTKTIELRVIQTSDVHGSFFPYDFINRKPKKGSLARVITYVDSLRKDYGKNLILLDNGDILQGQPTCYYYNYVRPELENVAAKVINYMGYDAETFGNHDVETGHAVYDKWVKEVKCPMLGANIIDTKTGKPYVKPYTIIERDGVKVAVLGMLTPAIPNWLNESLWKGLRFDDIVKSSKQWVKYLKENEHPDVIIGLLHSGREGGIKTADYEEDEAMRVAKEVEGIDLVLYGHDHTAYQGTVKNVGGNDVVLLDPSCNAEKVADAKITLTIDEQTIKGKKAHRLLKKEITGEVVSINDKQIDEKFMAYFKDDMENVNSFVNRKIGRFESSISTRDCYFGSAAFVDFIHDLQLQITGADVSFNAPLAFDASINEGDIYVSDMFNLYKFENQIYVLRMTGEEIRKHLEMSYDLWGNTMKSKDDHALLLTEHSWNDYQRCGFKNLAFNFDSAAGIDYEVDLTKPDGQKVSVLRMSNGKPFDEKAWYKVAMNSYRGNGGGELLTRGAGIALKDIPGRIVYESEKDLRYYLMKEIEKAGVMNPKAHGNWKFVPEKWTKPALEKDKQLLFK